MWERHNLAGQHSMQNGRPQEAEQSFQLALAEAEKISPDDPKVAITLINLANCLRQQGRFPHAEPLYKRAIEIKEKKFGPLHQEMIPALDNYAKMLRAAGREFEADKLDKKARAIFSR